MNIWLGKVPSLHFDWLNKMMCGVTKYDLSSSLYHINSTKHFYEKNSTITIIIIYP